MAAVAVAVAVMNAGKPAGTAIAAAGGADVPPPDPNAVSQPLELKALSITGAPDGTTCNGEPGFSRVRNTSGQLVTVESKIDAAQLLDGDLSTGWRCTYHPDSPPNSALAGKPRTHWGYDPSKAPQGPLTAGLGLIGGPAWITRVCLVPGTVRISDDGGANRWYENGRVTAVTWRFFNGELPLDGTDLQQSIVLPDWPGRTWRTTLTNHDYWYRCIDLPSPVRAETVSMTIDHFDAGSSGALAGSAKPSEVEIWGHA